jgi:general stress protein YciG
MNTLAGGIKYKQTMIERHGSEEVWKHYMRSIASKGGQAKVPKGFALNRELAKLAGSKGGTISKRTR